MTSFNRSNEVNYDNIIFVDPTPKAVGYPRIFFSLDVTASSKEKWLELAKKVNLKQVSDEKLQELKKLESENKELKSKYFKVTVCATGSKDVHTFYYKNKLDGVEQISARLSGLGSSEKQIVNQSLGKLYSSIRTTEVGFNDKLTVKNNVPFIIVDLMSQILEHQELESTSSKAEQLVLDKLLGIETSKPVLSTSTPLEAEDHAKDLKEPESPSSSSSSSSVSTPRSPPKAPLTRGGKLVSDTTPTSVNPASPSSTSSTVAESSSTPSSSTLVGSPSTSEPQQEIPSSPASSKPPPSPASVLMHRIIQSPRSPNSPKHVPTRSVYNFPSSSSTNTESNPTESKSEQTVGGNSSIKDMAAKLAGTYLKQVKAFQIQNGAK